MAALSDYAELAVLNAIAGRANFTAPAAVYIALGGGDFTDTGTAVAEISGNGYARQQVVFGTDAANGQISNTSEITFPVATGNQGAVTHYKLMDAINGGNCLIVGELTAAKTITTNDQLRIQIGDLTLTAN